MKKPFQIKGLLVILCVLALIIPLVLSCAPKPSPAKAVIIKYNDMGGPKTLKALLIQDFGAEAERRTGGRVKFEYYWSQALAKSKEIREATATGICDAGTWVGVYEPAKFGMALVGDLPLICPDIYPGMMAEYELYKTQPELKAELNENGVELLFPFTTGLIHIYSRMPIAKLEDLSGKKMNFLGKQGPLFKKLGAAIVAVPSAEVYTSVERGVLDGGQCYLFTYRDYGWWEVADHLTIAGLGQILAYGAVVNLELWNNLPKDVRKIMEGLRDEWVVEYAKRFSSDEMEIRKWAKDKGAIMHEFDPATRAKLLELAKPVWADWAAEQEAKGKPGKKVLERYQELYSKYEEEVKAKGYPWEQK